MGQGNLAVREQVALFLPSLRGGGAERVAVRLVKSFLDEGLNVDLVLAKAEGPYLAELPDKAGFRLFDLKSSRVLYSLPGLTRYLKFERPFALLSFMNYANIIAIWAKKWAKYTGRLIVSERTFLSSNFSENRKFKSKSNGYFNKKMNVFLCQL